MNWRQALKLAKSKYGLKEILWDKRKGIKYYGRCWYEKGVVYLNYDKLYDNEKRKLQVLFHELGHIYCYRNKIWKSYHTRPRTRQQKRKLIATGLKAERWIDNWAEKEIRKYIPGFIFVKGYNNKEKVKYYREEYLGQFK